MNVEREDFLRVAEKLKSERVDEHRTQLTMLKQAGVKAEHLTSDPAWDQFLSFLQFSMEANIKVREQAQAQMFSPNISNPDEIAALRMAVIRANDRVSQLDAIMKLPREIKEKGKEAANLLIDTEAA